jgi:group I intron endonuclease
MGTVQANYDRSPHVLSGDRSRTGGGFAKLPFRFQGNAGGGRPVSYGLIYKAAGPTGKVYVGQTTLTLKRRKSNHAFRAKKDDRRTPFQAALLDEGFSNFTWEQIDTAETQEELDQKEKQWIAYYDSMNPDKGYNNQEGGKKTVYSLEARKKMSEARKKRIITEDTKKRLSEALKGKPRPWQSGKHPSEETRRKISEAGKGRCHSEESKLKMSEAKKGKAPYVITEETRRRMSEAHKRNNRLAAVKEK